MDNQYDEDVVQNSEEPMDFPDLPDDEIDSFLDGTHPLSSQYGFGSQEEEESNEDEEQEVEDVAEGDVEDTEDHDEDESEEVDSTAEEAVEDEESESTEEEPKPANKQKDSSDVTLEDLLEPIKANGGTIQVRSPADAKRLIQMGANYSQKMAQLKPHLRTVKMLEQQGLLEDADRLNLMVEAFNGNKQAISKLFAETDLDPLDVDLDAAKDYKSSDYQVSEQEYELHSTIQELAQQPQFGRVRDLITGWDKASQETLSAQPQMLEGLSTIAGNEEAFTAIMDKVQTLRFYGEVPAHIPDVEVFGQVAKQYYEELAAAESNTNQSTSETKQKSKQEAEVKRTVQRKKAIAPTRGTSRRASEPQYTVEDLMDMSEEEFSKLSPSQLFTQM